MAKVSSKGQFAFPAKFKKDFGDLEIGNYIYFHLSRAEQVVYLSKDEVPFIPKSKLTSENLLTIPGDIRFHLNIQKGDKILFSYDAKRGYLYFKKETETETCPICNGETVISGKSCVVCQEKGVVEKEFWLNEVTRLMAKGRNYQVSVTITNADYFLNSRFKEEIHPYPTITLESHQYPVSVMDQFQDYYQVRIFQDLTKKSELFDKNLVPSFNPVQNMEHLRDQMVSSLKTATAKEQYGKWFNKEIIERLE
jgi:bifunctional DNA-binding transcriptional regulator/antitoxin component of YhaV-PrlF toxin-antitoxin module